jgi:hypothetical protein
MLGNDRWRSLVMRRIWLVLFAIVSMNSVLLSGCPVSPPGGATSHEGGGGGGGY